MKINLADLLKQKKRFDRYYGFFLRLTMNVQYKGRASFKGKYIFSVFLRNSLNSTSDNNENIHFFFLRG